MLIERHNMHAAQYARSPSSHLGKGEAADLRRSSCSDSQALRIRALQVTDQAAAMQGSGNSF